MAGAVAFTSAGVAVAEKGVDVSSWQHVDGRFIDWFAVRGSGHQFSMVKATEGVDYTNPYFIQDCLLMRVAGVSRGAYHYAQPGQSPEIQAVRYATMVLGINGPGDLPPVIDFENSGGLPPAALADWLHRYLNTVQGLTGRRPIIYTYPVFWKTAMANTSDFSQYPLWIADYRGNPQPEVPGGWNTWTFWQYTSSGSVPGIAGPTDVNVYSGAQGPFNNYANGGLALGSS